LWVPAHGTDGAVPQPPRQAFETGRRARGTQFMRSLKLIVYEEDRTRLPAGRNLLASACGRELY
jgi:hypothetical protein